MPTVLENMLQAKSDLSGIKNAITSKGVNVPGNAHSSTFADKVVEVYEKGKLDGSGVDTDAIYNEGYVDGVAAGKTEGYAAGVEQGKVDERTTFWEIFQDGGKRESYNAAFKSGYTDENYNPIYPIRGTGSGLANCFNANKYITNIKVPVIITSGGAQAVFYAMENLLIIPSLTFSETVTISSFFYGCTKLQRCIMHGVIACNYPIHYSEYLDKESHLSIFDCLAATTTGLTVTFSLAAVNKAFETSKGANDGSTSEEWLNLVATKENWTIVLS